MHENTMELIKHLESNATVCYKYVSKDKKNAFSRSFPIGWNFEFSDNFRWSSRVAVSVGATGRGACARPHGVSGPPPVTWQCLHTEGVTVAVRNGHGSGQARPVSESLRVLSRLAPLSPELNLLGFVEHETPVSRKFWFKFIVTVLFVVTVITTGIVRSVFISSL